MKSEREIELEAEIQAIREQRRIRSVELLDELVPLGEAREVTERELERLRTEIRAKAVEARAAGASVPKIAAALRLAHQSVYTMLERSST